MTVKEKTRVTGKTDKSILLVEDSEDEVELALRALHHDGVPRTIHVVRDGVEALEWLLGPDAESRADLPAVVLLDLQLPRLGGIDVLRRLRASARTRYLPIVILSSSRNNADIEASYREGASSFVRKPDNYKGYVDAARHLAAYWLSLNELPRPHDDTVPA